MKSAKPKNLKALKQIQKNGNFGCESNTKLCWKFDWAFAGLFAVRKEEKRKRVIRVRKVGLCVLPFCEYFKRSFPFLSKACYLTVYVKTACIFPCLCNYYHSF